jgi:hypothetical protein
MGRGAGCCNFKYTVNCTAPPCPEGTCCYVDTDRTTFNSISILESSRKYTCEDDVTENCCLTKHNSFFNANANCGEIEACDDQSSVAAPTIVSTDKAFILLKHNGSVVAWGDSETGGAIPSNLESYLSNITNLYTNSVSVVAVTENGFAFSWGDINITNADTSLFSPDGVVSYFENIKSVTSSLRSFAAIRTDGTVVAWGDPEYGGSIPSSISSLLVNIVEIVSTDKYFAARDKDGKIFIWGNGEKAYDKLDVTKDGSITALDVLQILNFLNISQTEAVSNPDFTTGFYKSSCDVNRGGSVTALDALNVLNSLALGGIPSYDSGFTDVKRIYSNKNAFAFLKNDGTVLVWGDDSKGGDTGSRHSSLTNVKEIYNTDEAFLAHRTDNKIVVWGDIDTTAGPDSDFYDEVIDVVASKYAFGISYLVQGTIGSFISLSHYFDVLGSIVRNKQTRVERVNYAGRNPSSKGVVNNNTRVRLHAGFLNTYTAPYDHKNRPTDIDGGTIVFQRDFYASDYAFHFANIRRSGDGQYFYLIGQSPDSEHYSHTLRFLGATEPVGQGLTIKNGGVNQKIDRAETFLVDNPVGSLTYETADLVPIKGAKYYVDTLKATAFLVGGGTQSHSTQRSVFGSPLIGVNYVVSLGHADYGGIGSSFLRTIPNVDSNNNLINKVAFSGRERGTTGSTIFLNRANFAGLYSNNHAFCAVRFDNLVDPTQQYGDDGQIHPDNQDGVVSYGGGSQATYDIFVWGDKDFGGDSSNVDFSNVFANVKDLKFTYQGCHPDYCNQDI